jgi:hypothetical protein
MIVRSILAGVSLTLLCGCVSIQRFEPNAAGNQQCQLANGAKVCVSKQPDSTIMVSLHRSRDGFMPLLILIANESTLPFDVIPTDIAITARVDDHAASEVKVYGPIELEHTINARQGLEKGNLSLKPGQCLLENNQSKKCDLYLKDYTAMSALTQQQTMQSADFLNNLLRRQTLYPGQYITGMVWAAYQPADTYTVTYTVNDDVHVVEFNRIAP